MKNLIVCCFGALLLMQLGACAKDPVAPEAPRPMPMITAISPDTVQIGDTLFVSGTDLNARQLLGVKVDGVEATHSVVDATHIQVITPVLPDPSRVRPLSVSFTYDDTVRSSPKQPVLAWRDGSVGALADQVNRGIILVRVFNAAGDTLIGALGTGSSQSFPFVDSQPATYMAGYCYASIDNVVVSVNTITRMMHGSINALAGRSDNQGGWRYQAKFNFSDVPLLSRNDSLFATIKTTAEKIGAVGAKYESITWHTWQGGGIDCYHNWEIKNPQQIVNVEVKLWKQ
jgi:hypothetical protein